MARSRSFSIPRSSTSIFVLLRPLNSFAADLLIQFEWQVATDSERVALLFFVLKHEEDRMHQVLQEKSGILPNKICSSRALSAPVMFVLLIGFTLAAHGQSKNNTSIQGTVVDPTGAVVPGVTIEIRNPVSHFERTTTTDDSGAFNIPNVPFSRYHMTVTRTGFADYAQDIEPRSPVPLILKIALQLATAAETVTVESAGADLIEAQSTFHTDVDRSLIERLPLESSSSSVSSLVTLSTPGVSADSNGLFHGLGDHAENSFSLDGQPITDQQSKVFSNQIPLESIQSMEVISGAPPAEFGDKTSVVIQVTTRSGMGNPKPHGSVSASYGTFGTANAGFDLAYGGDKAGNYISINGLNTGRFLDPPEFTVMHAKGNQQNVFDRIDFKPSNADTVQFNLGFTRSWFQTPNSFDDLHLGVNNLSGNPIGPTDQRSQIKTFNIAPSWTHLINSNSVFTAGAFVRRDQYNYYPSSNPLADFSPIQSLTIVQDRNLTNAGLRSDVNYTQGILNVIIGATYQ